MKIDNYANQISKSSTDFFYDSLTEKWKSESYPGWEHKEKIYTDRHALLNIVSQNIFDWKLHVHLPRFSDSVISKLTSEFLNPVLSWLENLRKGPQNLVLIGSNGSGKTFAAVAACRFLTLHGLTTDTGNLFMPITRVFNCPNAHNELDNWSKTQNVEAELGIYKNIPILVLDDLGAVSQSAQSATANIASIIDYRYNMNLPVIITSNQGPDELGGMYGTTIIRRLINETSVLSFS